MTPPSRPTYGYWPLGGAGKYTYEHLDIALRKSAIWHANRAITLYTSSDSDECLSAAVSAGCAVELLTKSYLASIEPTLIVADRDDGQSILVLAGQLDKASIEPTAIRSKSATECLAIAKKLHPSLRWHPKTEMAVLNVRNAACHLGLVDAAELASAIKIMVKIAEDFIPALSASRDRFWSVHNLTVVDGLLDEAAKELALAVNAKVARARSYLDSLTERLPDPTAEALLAALVGTMPRSFADHEELHTCPVCKHDGWLICGVDRGSVVWDEDSSGDKFAYVERTAFPITFECNVCNLELEGDELAEFSFPDEIELEPDYEPYEVGDWDPTDL